MKEKRSKRLLRDILLFAIASFAPKMLSFFLVPLYTSCLDTETYGLFDLLGTITSLILPILMLDISDAIMIYTIENKETKKENQPLRFGTEILSISSLVLVFILVVVGFIFTKHVRVSYLVYILLNYFTLSLYNNLLAYVRGKDRVDVVVISSVINSIVTLSSNVFFILVAKMGLHGLMIANIIGTLISDVYISTKVGFCKLISKTASPNNTDKHIMLSYSIPLIFTGLAWWVNSSSDRFFISIFAGVSINGIYAVANKIPTILSACHSIVYQAMQLSVFKEIHAEDKSDYLKSLYDIYFFIMIVVCSCLIIMDKMIAKFLFKGDFYIAWKYSPALLISIAFFSIAGYLTTIYAAEKETKTITKATVLGATINSVLNLLLIPRYKLYGAVIATLVGYFLIWLIMAFKSKKIVGVTFDIWKGIVCLCILVIQWIVLVKVEKSYIYECILLLAIMAINFKSLKRIMSIGIGLVHR